MFAVGVLPEYHGKVIDEGGDTPDPFAFVLQHE